MTIKLVQKHLLKGSQELELTDECVNVRSKAPFKDAEEITVMLTVIDPEPEITKSTLNFKSRVNGCPLISLYLGKPNTQEFNAFVQALKQKASEEFSAFAGLTPPTPPTATDASPFDESSELEDSAEEHLARAAKNVDPARIDSAIEMLNAQLGPEEIASFISVLETLKQDPNNPQLLGEVLQAFNELGPRQGAVLAYAPYISLLLSDSALRGR